jgi:MtfA peptidase
MFDFFKQRRLDRARPQAADFERICTAFPVLAALNPSDRERLFLRCTEILASKTFLGAQDFVPEADQVLAVAALAALPVLDLGVDWYRGFHTFILYPGDFEADLEEMDEAGVIHRARDQRAGEAWAHGPVVLGLDSVMQSGQGEGFNVVVHELAHQIDQLNGDMDGFPPLHESMNDRRWSEVFAQAYEHLCRELDQDLEPSLDPYAAESPAEFFAVLSELYFEVPEWLASQHGLLHEQLELFYHPGTSGHRRTLMA